jgi:hypothetical protein
VGRLLAFASVLGLAAASGGYAATTWGWAALALCWAAAVALVLGARRPSPLELAFFGGLLALAAWMGASTLWSQSVPASVLEVERAVVYVAGVAAALLLARRGAEDGVLAAAAVVCAWNLVHRIHGYDPELTGAGAEPIGYANGLGLLAAIGCLLSLRRRATWPLAALFVAELCLCASRGSWLALACGLAVAWRPRLAPVAAVVAAVVVALTAAAPRTAYWDVARADAGAHPALGSGAGTFHQVWVERRPTPNEAFDAHSLYLETLAELGPLGLALVAGTLVLPFLRGRGLALGAYAAFVVQAGIDWEWELPAVTLAGLLCGVAALRPDRPSTSLLQGTRSRAPALVATLALAAFAAVGLAGNRAIAGGDVAAAKRWAPWSAEPYRIESRRRGGDAELLREAIRRDPNDWSLWGALAQVASGPERKRAAAMAARLNPLGAENAPTG